MEQMSIDKEILLYFLLLELYLEALPVIVGKPFGSCYVVRALPWSRSLFRFSSPTTTVLG